MIRFYKKVRDFNWKYAFGEVSLIFIGITLAVWFNNWNQRRIDTGKKFQYFSSLKSDLQSDVIHYEELIVANNQRMKGINRFGELLADLSHSEVNCDSVQKYLAGASFINVFIGSSTVFDDLESTGNLLLINNNLLKRDIMEYYAKVNSRKQYEDLNARFHINTIGLFLKKYWNTGALFRQGVNEKQLNISFAENDCQSTLQKIQAFQKDIHLNQELVNHINFSFFIMSMNNDEYKIMKQMAKDLILAIEQQ
jgi:hypothetical protein